MSTLSRDFILSFVPISLRVVTLYLLMAGPLCQKGKYIGNDMSRNPLACTCHGANACTCVSFGGEKRIDSPGRCAASQQGHAFPQATTLRQPKHQLEGAESQSAAFAPQPPSTLCRVTSLGLQSLHGDIVTHLHVPKVVPSPVQQGG